jgi:hypothetical protein
MVCFSRAGDFLSSALAFSEASQRARLDGTLQGAGECVVKRELPQALAELASMFLATFVERQIGPARVLMRVRPRRVAVPGEIEFRQLC